MDLEKRLTNLENLIHALIRKMDNVKFYQNAEVAGVRHGQGEMESRLQSEVDYLAIMTDTEMPEEEAI